MSPVARSSGHAGRALLVSAVAVVVIGLVMWGAAVMVNRQDASKVRLGDQTFQGGSTERLSAEIDDRGPILYPDPSGGDRPIILQHLGSDPDKGWYAFLAHPSDRNASCTWVWKPSNRTFAASCDPSVTAPADGKGLERYPVTVRNGRLDVDLNYADRTTTTTSPPTTARETGNAPSTTTG